MALESGTYISDLEPNNPTGQDDPKQGDDHLRLIKFTLKNTFPNIDGEVTITDEELNGIVQDIADAVLKAGDTMTGDLLFVDYKSVQFLVGADDDFYFAKIEGIDDRIEISIHDATDGTVLNTVSITGDVLTATSEISCVMPDGSAVNRAPTIAYGRQILVMIDSRDSGVSGGALTGLDDQWHSRSFGTEQYNGIVGASVSGSTITLPEGVYRINISCPAYRTDKHKTRLVDSLDALLLTGTSEKANEGDETQTRSFISGVITLSAETTMKVEHWVHLGSEGGQTFALGFPSSISGVNEIYSMLEIEKI